MGAAAAVVVAGAVVAGEVEAVAAVVVDLLVGVLCAGNKDTHSRTNTLLCFMSLMYIYDNHT